MLAIVPREELAACVTEAHLKWDRSNSESQSKQVFVQDLCLSGLSITLGTVKIKSYGVFAEMEVCTAHHNIQPGVCNLYSFFTKTLIHTILPSNSCV